MAWLSQNIGRMQNITIHRLRKIFGFKTERTSDLAGLINNEEKKSPEIDTNADDNKKNDCFEGLKDLSPDDNNSINDSEENQIPDPDRQAKEETEGKTFFSKRLQRCRGYKDSSSFIKAGLSLSIMQER